jgi:hypothetical protein
MNAHLIQNLVVAIVVVVSAAATLRRLMPGAFRRLQTGIARSLDQPHRSHALRAIGFWIQPGEAKSGGCGSGLGCGSCSGCGSSELATPAIPLVLQPRRGAESNRRPSRGPGA